MTVVAAIIEENDRFLVTRRPAGVHLAGLWEFPGGKIHPGETHAEALAREIREELDVAARVATLELEITHAYEDRTITLFFYRCEIEGRPRPALGQEMRWVARGELAAMGFPPADEQLIRRLARSVAT